MGVVLEERVTMRIRWWTQFVLDYIEADMSDWRNKGEWNQMMHREEAYRWIQKYEFSHGLGREV